jgi:hypothetical protein
LGGSVTDGIVVEGIGQTHHYDVLNKAKEVFFAKKTENVIGLRLWPLAFSTTFQDMSKWLRKVLVSIMNLKI